MQTEAETISAERWAAYQAKVAHHEAAHAVAYERLSAGQPLFLALEGSPDAPGRNGLDGRVHTLILPDADPRDMGISMLAGPAADMRLDDVSTALDAEEIRHFADSDTPDDVDDAELDSLWIAAVDFVGQNWSQIQAVACALLAAPVAPDDSGITHFLCTQDFRRILERAEP